jgi:hypothetical protein
MITPSADRHRGRTTLAPIAVLEARAHVRWTASHPALEARIEEVAEPVAHQVDAEDHRENREAGEQGEPQPVVK